MKYAFLFIAFAVLIGSCKYEEGPFISFRTKKGRIANKWAYDLVLSNGIDETADYKDSYIEFLKPDKVILSGDIGIDEGLWQFKSESKMVIKLFMTNSSGEDYTREWIITRLKENEMWLKEVSNTTIVEYHLVTFDK